MLFQENKEGKAIFTLGEDGGVLDKKESYCNSSDLKARIVIHQNNEENVTFIVRFNFTGVSVLALCYKSGCWLEKLKLRTEFLFVKHQRQEVVHMRVARIACCTLVLNSPCMCTCIETHKSCVVGSIWS